jgi:hypothetical protein
MFNHPAVTFVCRHCGKDAGYDPEMCIKCGPVCGECFEQKHYPCQSSEVKIILPPRKQTPPDYSGA